jgi:hypothetical protein
MVSPQLTALHHLSASKEPRVVAARKPAAKKNDVIDLTAESDGDDPSDEEESKEESDEESDGQGHGRKRKLFVARKIAANPMQGQPKSSVDDEIAQNNDDDEIAQENDDDDGDQISDAPTQKSNGTDERKLKARQEYAELHEFWQVSAEALEEREQVAIAAAKSPENSPVHWPTRRSGRKQQTPAQRGLDLRRRFFTTFHVCSGTDQSDPEGVGCLARRHINKGEEFIDPYATYTHGEPPGKVECTRGSYIKTKEGYFDLVPSATEWINAPSHGRVANVNFRSRYDSICGDGLSPSATKKLLVWKVVQPIDSGEEILAVYGGVEFDDGTEHDV